MEADGCVCAYACVSSVSEFEIEISLPYGTRTFVDHQSWAWAVGVAVGRVGVGVRWIYSPCDARVQPLTRGFEEGVRPRP